MRPITLSNIWNAYINQINQKDLKNANIVNLQKGYQKYFMTFTTMILDINKDDFYSITDKISIDNMMIVKSLINDHK